MGVYIEWLRGSRRATAEAAPRTITRRVVVVARHSSQRQPLIFVGRFCLYTISPRQSSNHI